MMQAGYIPDIGRLYEIAGQIREIGESLMYDSRRMADETSVVYDRMLVVLYRIEKTVREAARQLEQAQCDLYNCEEEDIPVYEAGVEEARLNFEHKQGMLALAKECIDDGSFHLERLESAVRQLSQSIELRLSESADAIDLVAGRMLEYKGID